jgi:hypothetical protein
MPVEQTKSWVIAYESMKENYGLSDDAIGIFAIQLTFDIDDLKELAAESLTGGGDDKKCDVLYIDQELGIAVISQCYVGKPTKVAAKSDKAADLNTAIGWLLSADIAKLPEGIKARAEELREAISAGKITQIHAWYVHNLPCSANVQKELKTVEATLKSSLKNYPKSDNINVFSKEIGTNELQQLYVQAERPIIVTDSFDIIVPEILEMKEYKWSSITTFVKGTWLSEIYSKHKTDLFSANLRGYLGSRESDANINHGIKITAKNEPENFSVFNNGITALVLDYKIEKKTTAGRKIKIIGISIVNGAQTTGSISSVRGKLPENISVPIRFVKAESDDLIGKIVKFNNSQNKLQAADYRSGDATQDRLRSEFQSVPNAEYEGGRRGGASDAIKRSRYTLSSYTVAQSLTAFHGDPVTAYNKKSDIWTNDKTYLSIFTNRTSARHIVFCYSLLEAINERKFRLMSQQKRDENSLIGIEQKTLQFLNRRGSSFLLIYAIAQCFETILGKPIPNKFDLRFKKNMSPEDAKSVWMPILDAILPLTNQLEPAFSKGGISSENSKSAVQNLAGVFAAIADAQKTKFAEFSKKISLA